jgi:nucleoside-diphosphate-sugar epimerase
MKIIDKTKPVLVTGATGYVASWIVKKLLDEGITVHAAVRHPENKAKLEHLDKIAESSSGSIKYFKADLMVDGSYAEAMEGCELVFHTASPFTLDVEDPQKQLIEPAVNGTRNVLTQASKTSSVKRIVDTSSCAAIYCDAIDTVNAPNGKITEASWNSTASLKYQPYAYSKTLAEKEAWKISEAQSQWDLVVINPSFVMGPALNASVATSESVSILKQLGDGSLKMGVPNMGFGVIDVRDLAEAHFNAGFTPEAEGRHIINGHNSTMLQMAQIVHTSFGDKYPVPNKSLPKWLLMLVGPLANKGFTRNFIRNNVNIPWNADNTKGREKLAMNYRPLEETMTDSFQALVDAGMFNKK